MRQYTMIIEIVVPEPVLATLPAEADATVVLGRVQELLQQALTANAPLHPTLSSPTEGRRLRLRVGRQAIAAITMSQRQRPRAASVVFTELLLAGLAVERAASSHDDDRAGFAGRSASAHESAEPHREPAPTWRPVQAEWRTQLRAALATGDNPIVLAEASTGIGKSRVLADIARDALATASADRPIVIAAPTVAVLQHLLQEARLVDAASVDAHAQVLLGRGQFVDVDALDAWLADLPPELLEGDRCLATVATVRAWRANQGPAVPHAPTALLHHASPSLAWLAADLHAIASSWPLDDLLLRADALPNAGADAWAAHLAQAQDARWIFTTHALLASDIRTRRYPRLAASGRLPHIGLLILDEAHQFDGIVANTVGHDVAISRVITDLKAIEAVTTRTTQTLARAARLAATAVMEATRAMTGPTQQMLAPGAIMEPSWRPLRLALGGATTARRARLLQAATALQHVVAGRQWVALDRSPVRRWPSFAVGATSLRQDYARFWAVVDRAVLTSATLALPTGGAGHGRRIAESYDVMASDVLRVPATRRINVAPLRPAWVTAGVTLMVPGTTPAVRDALTPPRASRARTTASAVTASAVTSPPVASVDIVDSEPDPQDDLTQSARRRWWIELARLIAGRIQPTAAGGTLVLCASYDDVQGISDALRLAGLLESVLLEQQRGHGISGDRATFVHRARAGVRPVWCATGAAWTGLDCRDLEARTAAEDRVLTDLVIPRIPWNQNRSLVHATRARQQPLKYETADTALRLRQGLGRLVRQEGLRHRRIWMLDARCWASVDAPHAAYYRLIRHVLSGYAARQVIEEMPRWNVAANLTDARDG
jgi:ATP-dependent DNA helicase DinG